MQLRLLSHTDPNAAEMGTIVFSGMVEAHREAGLFLPATCTPGLFTNLWVNDALKVFAVFEGARVIGIRTVVLSPCLFNDSVMMASTTTLYVHPDARHRGAGKMLMQQGDIYLKQLGIVMSVTMFTPRDAAKQDAAELGYEPKVVLAERQL